MGRAMLGVMAVFAQLTREMIAENVKDGLMRRAQAGLYVGNGNGPLGYSYDPEKNHLKVMPEEADTVRLVYSLFVDRKWGIDKIAGYLSEMNAPTKMGGNWHKLSVGKILRNPIYIGKLKGNGQVYDGHHDAILPVEVFEAAQTIIASRSTLPGRSHQSQHLLSGLAICGECGKRLIAHYGRANKSGERAIFYHHRASLKKSDCKSFYKSARRLEKIVIDQIRKAAESDLLSAIAAEELHRQTTEKSQPLKARQDSILSELAEMKEKFNTWADRLDNRLIDEEQFIHQNSRLLKRKQELQRELQQIERELSQCENAEVSFESACSALKEFPKVWDHLEIEEKRELVRLLIEKLEVGRHGLILKIAYLAEEKFHL